MGFERLNEVLSFPSWERERAWRRFLTLLFYFAAASPSRCLNVTDYFTAVRGFGRGEQRGKRKVWPELPELLASPMPQLPHRKHRLEGTGGKFTFLGKQEPGTGC